MDEPTTALDISVVAHVSDDVMVMYLGRPVEIAGSDAIFEAPEHPYTRALLSATPRPDPERKRERIQLTGELPSPFDPPSGCVFHPRCPYASERCRAEIPELRRTSDGGAVARHASEEGRLPA